MLEGPAFFLNDLPGHWVRHRLFEDDADSAPAATPPATASGGTAASTSGLIAPARAPTRTAATTRISHIAISVLTWSLNHACLFGTSCAPSSYSGGTPSAVA